MGTKRKRERGENASVELENGMRGAEVAHQRIMEAALGIGKT